MQQVAHYENILKEHTLFAKAVNTLVLDIGYKSVVHSSCCRRPVYERMLVS